MVRPNKSDTPSPAQVPKPSPPLTRRLQRWLIEPSPLIEGADQRRQATLLSGFLLALIVIGILAEGFTVLLIDWETYTGYRQTAVGLFFIAITYTISRTRHVQLAATLAVVVAIGALYFSGLSQPNGVVSGFFDYMIVPLWLGSLFIDIRKLPLLIGSSLGGILIYPLWVPEVTFNEILVGPFTFTLTTSVLMLIITRHRDRLEADRREQLEAEEALSRREAARSAALLRVAERLNAQLDLESVRKAIGEEVARALGAEVSVVTVYDPGRSLLHAVSAAGLSPEEIESLPTLSKAEYDAITVALGSHFCVPDLQADPGSPYFGAFRRLDLMSIAFATMEYEHELIGSLCAFSRSSHRDFTEEDLILLKGLADQAALALINTRLFKDAHRRLERLQALRAIDIAITTNHDLREMLQVLLEKITEQLKVDAAVFLLLDEQRQQLDFAASLGFRTSALRFTRLRPGEGLAGRAAMERTIIRHDLKKDPQTLAYAPTIGLEGFETYYAAPLIAQGKVSGVLEVFHRGPITPDGEWLSFLEALAGQAAIAIENTTLFEDLQRINAELFQAYDSTIEGWSHALDLRDQETEGHTQRVTSMTLELAQAMGLDKQELIHIRRGSLLHDIGKMGVPDRILHKPGPLDNEEWEIMQKHPTNAYELLSPIVYLRRALDIPYCHHEKWDGTGYPRGLRGEQIPLAARIFAVVDVYDALTSDRPYRKAWSPEKTRTHIRGLAGTHFDPLVVKAFLALFDKNRTNDPF